MKGGRTEPRPHIQPRYLHLRKPTGAPLLCGWVVAHYHCVPRKRDRVASKASLHGAGEVQGTLRGCHVP
jgi:hypothetical protein